jgi:hypothetical protein
MENARPLLVFGIHIKLQSDILANAFVLSSGLNICTMDILSLEADFFTFVRQKPEKSEDHNWISGKKHVEPSLKVETLSET